jgi:hypothetical protein
MSTNEFPGAVTVPEPVEGGEYPFDLDHAGQEEILAWFEDADGARTYLALNTDYTVAPEAMTYGGGVFTLLAAPPAGATLTIGRSTRELQDASFKPAEKVFERALDKLTHIAQDLRRRVTFAVVQAADRIKLTPTLGDALTLLGTSPTEAGLLTALDKHKLDTLGDGVQIGETLMFLSKPQVEAATVDAGTIYLYLLGGAVPGDGDRGPYARVGGDPGAVDKVQSANGVWFQKAPLAIDASLIAGLTAFAAARLAEDSAGAGRTALGLVIGTHVQAYSARLAQIAAASWQVGDLAQVVDIGGGVPGFARLAKGTAGQLLRMNDAGTALAYHDAPFMQIMPETDAAGMASIAVSLPVGFGRVEVDFANWVPATSSAFFIVRLRSVATGSVRIGASDYRWDNQVSGVELESAGASYIRTLGNAAIPTTAGMGASGTFIVRNARDAAARTHVTGNLFHNVTPWMSLAGELNTAEANDQIVLRFDTQNIAAGKVSARAWR